MFSRQSAILTSQSQENPIEAINPHYQSTSYAAAALMNLSNSSRTRNNQENQNMSSSQNPVRRMQRQNNNIRPLGNPDTDSSNPSERSSRQASVNNNTNYVPTRKAAIILENTQNVTQDECLRAVADIISGSNIHYCSRLSGGRICLYLSDESHVETMCEREGINISEQFITCRRYVSEATKFIISNCPPELTDDHLKELLEPYGRVVSAPARLRVSTAYEDLRHVKTWRRSVYLMIPHDAPEMPKRMMITSPEGVKHTLYIDKDDIMCTFCMVPGHTVDNCKKRKERDDNFPAFYPPPSHRLLIRKPVREKPSPTEKIPLMPTFKSSHTPNATDKVSEESNKSAEEQEEPNKNDQKDTTSEFQETNNNNNQTVKSLWGDLDLDLNQLPSMQIEQNQPKPNENQILQEKETTEELNLITSRTHSRESIMEVVDGPQTEIANETWNDLTSNELFDKLIYKKSKDKKRVLSLSPNTPDNKEPKIMKTCEEMKESQRDEFSESDSSCSSQNFSASATLVTGKTKKRKLKEEASLQLVLNQMKFTDSELSEETFKLFLSECRGKANSPKIAAKYKASTSELIKKLQEAELICKEFNLQRRLKRAAEALTPNEEN